MRKQIFTYIKEHKNIVWTGVAVLLAVISIGAVLAYSRELTIGDIFHIFATADPRWMTAAVLCAIGYIFFEALALQVLLNHTGQQSKFHNSLTYSAADIYCAAIPPSATGGQPVCAWFMVRDGVPIGVVSAILLAFLIMHTLATVLIGLVSLVWRPGVFFGFSIYSQIFIVLGYVTLTALGVFFLFLTKLDRWIFRTGCRLIDWLTKKKLIKRTDYWKNWYKKIIDDYSSSFRIMYGKGGGVAWAAVFLLNVLQRMAQQSVSSLVYMATGGDPADIPTVFVSQVFTAIGSMCVPVPGGSGVADFLLLDGLMEIMDKQSAVQLELLSRGLSFYVCVLTSLVIVLAAYFLRRQKYSSSPVHK